MSVSSVGWCVFSADAVDAVHQHLLDACCLSGRGSVQVFLNLDEDGGPIPGRVMHSLCACAADVHLQVHLQVLVFSRRICLQGTQKTGHVL